MNAAGDYSSAYCILKTDGPLTGHGMVCDVRCGTQRSADRLTQHL